MFSPKWKIALAALALACLAMSCSSSVKAGAASPNVRPTKDRKIAELEKQLAKASLAKEQSVHETVQNILAEADRPPNTEQQLNADRCHTQGKPPGCKLD